jgi:hypothetical protein
MLLNFNVIYDVLYKYEMLYLGVEKYAFLIGRVLVKLIDLVMQI